MSTAEAIVAWLRQLGQGRHIALADAIEEKFCRPGIYPTEVATVVVKSTDFVYPPQDIACATRFEFTNCGCPSTK